MNELQRLQYLEALDITQWVSREALPHAKPTETVDLNTLLPQVEQAPTEAHAVDPAQHQSAQSETPQPETPQQNTPSLEQKISNKKPPRKIILDAHKPNSDPRVPEANVQNKEQASTQTSQETATQTTTQTQNSPQEQQAVNFAFQVQGKRGQYLLVAELMDHTGIITAEEQTLLNNIAKAIDALYDEQSTTLIAPEQFKWPMFQAHPNAEFINPGQEAAQESACAFIASHIKRNLAQTIVVLGASLVQYLALPKQPALENSAHPQLGRVPIIQGESLSEMLNPTQAPTESIHNKPIHAKAKLWQTLLQEIKNP